MAEKILNTRILMKVDTLENWEKSTLKLKRGELAFATVAASAGTGLAEPVVMVKIGTEEEKTFGELPWAFHAKASDVLTACKTEAGLKAFVNSVIADAGIATNSAMEALAGRVTTAEGKVTTLEGKMTAVEGKAADNAAAIEAIEGRFGAETVAAEINAVINALNLAGTYEAKGEAAKVQTALETYKTSNDAAVKKVSDDLAAEISRAGVAEKANADAIALIKDGTTIDSFADVESALAGKETSGAAAQALVDAKAYADGLAGNYDAKGAAATAESNAKAYAKEYADGLAGNYDAAGSASAAETAAKGYTDSELDRLVGDKTVGTQITEAITGLDLANTYAAKSHKHVKADITDFAHTHEMSEVNGLVDALAGKEAAGAAEAALEEAMTYADGLDEAMDVRVKAVEAKLGTGEGGVDAQIAAAVEAEAKLRDDADKELAADIKAIADDYLKAADKTALQDQITANDGEIAALQGLVGDKKVSEAIAAAVLVEENRAKGVEGGLETRLAAVEADYLTSVEEKALQDQITANAEAIELLTNGVSADEVDGVNDLIQYVKEHGTEVTGIKADIKANADAIDAIEADYLKAADKTELEGKITAAQNAADKAQGEVDALEGVVAGKAAQADLEAAVGRVATLEGEMDSAEGRLDALEELVGDDKVSEAIDAAIEALKIGDYAKAADLTAAVNRVTAAEGKITTLEGQMSTAEGKISTLETEVAKKANDADLAAIAKTGNVNDLVQTAGDVLIFDCGTSV